MMSEPRGLFVHFVVGGSQTKETPSRVNSQLCVYGARLWMGLQNLLMCLDNEITEKRRAMSSISRGPTGN